MSRLDDRLTQELERIARPVDPTQAFERVERRRSRLHTRRRIQSAGLVAVVLLGTIGGFMFLSDAFHSGGTTVGSSVTPIPSATVTTPPGPVDMGLGFPVCDLRSMSADFDGNGTSDTASVVTKMSDAGGCPEPGAATEILAVNLDGDGKADAVGGPLACPSGCEPFAAPDVDGDGLPEVAIVVDRANDGTKRIQLWDITTPPGGSLAVIPFVDANGDPASFAWGTVNVWGGSGPEVFGVSCTSRTSPPLVTEWQAIPTISPPGPESWHISEHGYHVVGSELRSAFEDSYDVPGEETVFPDGGGDTMCGAPVSSTSPVSANPDVPSMAGPTTIPGVSQTACNVTDVTAHFWGSSSTTVFIYQPEADAGDCSDTESGSSMVGIAPDGGVVTATYGPLNCQPVSCYIFGTPDVDGDGRAELAVVESSYGSGDVVQVYTVVVNEQPTLVLWQAGGGPLRFDWDPSVETPAGAFCQRNADYDLALWSAGVNPDGTYDLVEVFYRFEGSDGHLVSDRDDKNLDPSKIAPGGGSTFCGAPVTP